MKIVKTRRTLVKELSNDKFQLDENNKLNVLIYDQNECRKVYANIGKFVDSYTFILYNHLYINDVRALFNQLGIDDNMTLYLEQR